MLFMVNDETGCGLTYRGLEILSLHPYVVVATSFTVKVSAERKLWDGVVEVEVTESPKIHRYVEAPVAVLVNSKLLRVRHWLLFLILNDEIG